jgi:hypothetical protein
MLTLEEVRARLADRNLAKVSKRANLHYNVVYRVAAGITVSPSYETVKALSDYLTAADADPAEVVS